MFLDMEVDMKVLDKPQTLKMETTTFICHNPTLGLSVRMKLTLPKLGTWSPLGLPNV